ncbi:MAG: hypothetical protein AAFO77_06075, partial [Pseudomonadota bacterium]
SCALMVRRHQSPDLPHLARGTYVPQYAVRDVSADSVPAPGEEGLGFDAAAPSRRKTQFKRATVRIEPDTPVSPFIVRNLRRIWIAVGSMIAMLVLILGLLWGFRPGTPEFLAAPEGAEQFVPSDTGFPMAAVVLSDNDDRAEFEPLLAEFRNGASRFQTVRIISALPEPLDIAAATYQLSLTPRGDDRVDVSLTNVAAQELVWQGALTGRSETAIASMLTTLFPEDGIIYRDAERRETLNEAGLCLARIADFFAEQSAPRFEPAFGCTTRQVEANPNGALMHAQRANLIVEGLRDNYALAKGFTVSDAMQAANRAIELQPLLPQGHRSLGNTMLFTQDSSPAVDAFKRAFELNPYDLSLSASYGFALYEAGNCRQAVALLDRATGNIVGHPSWWDYTKFLCAFELGDRRVMAKAANGLARFDRSYYIAARAISAQANGDLGLRDMLIARLSEKNTGLTRDPKSYYARFLPERLAGRMYGALIDAGFVGSTSGE